ncbi:unnamed protein product [Euphydryas editha]|nr:unnamed protein product [Euphydryas editha]
MESRQEQLSQLRDFIKEAEKEVTLILQTLQWDRNTLMQEIKTNPMVICKYDSNHRIPVEKQKEHEEKCFLKSQGYKLDDMFLPDPLYPDGKTLIKLTSDEIKQIIDAASKKDPLFKRGNGSVETEPWTWARMVTTYTTDERRAIYDAVVNAMPSAHDLSDLALASTSAGASQSEPKSRLQVLAELRDMRRRRARYRGCAPARNYSHTLRELIATQMELYTGSNTDTEIEQNNYKATKTRNDTHREENDHTRKEKNIKERIREDSKDREHYTRDSKEKYQHTDGNYSKKRERESSTHSEMDRRYSRHDDRRRQEKYDRDFISRERKRQREDEKHRHKERKDDRYRRSEKIEHTRYYDNRYEKSEGYTSKEKSRSKEYR